MIPYILLSIGMLVLYSFIYPVVDMGLTPADFAFWLVYGSGPIERVSHLWFLRTMFFTIVVFLLIDKYLHDMPSILRYIIILCSPALGVMIKTAMGVELVPWGIDSVFIALSFMMIGNEIRRQDEFSSWSVSTSIDAIAISISMIVFVWLSLNNGFVNVGEGLYGESIYIHMITGVLFT
jgi:fucose 4-O-acetylase-like acetyltransferase